MTWQNIYNNILKVSVGVSNNKHYFKYNILNSLLGTAMYKSYQIILIINNNLVYFK